MPPQSILGIYSEINLRIATPISSRFYRLNCVVESFRIYFAYLFKRTCGTYLSTDSLKNSSPSFFSHASRDYFWNYSTDSLGNILVSVSGVSPQIILKLVLKFSAVCSLQGIPRSILNSWCTWKSMPGSLKNHFSLTEVRSCEKVTFNP